LQAILAPIVAGSDVASLSSVRIVENNPGTAVIEASRQTGGTNAAKIVWRLTTGQTFVELRPGEGVEKVRIEAPSQYVAVPDFFGDDMVFSAASSATNDRFGLPAENFFLQFIGRGQGLLMCVWPSGRQQAATLVTGQGSHRTISGTEIQCAAGKSLWIAALVAPGIWHEHVQPSAQESRETVLDWKPPCPAKWRVSMSGTTGIGPSWYFRGSDDADEFALTAEQSPCCLDAQRALVRLPAASGAQPMLVYPIDRTRTTPLTTFCPIDILRATLGVGPCQYILQTEGLASDTNPTPDSVMTWVEKQFAKKKEKKAADEIREMLAQMVAQVEQADRRVAAYRDLARDVRAMCGNKAPDAIRPAIDALDRSHSRASGPEPSVHRARRLTDEIAGLIGKPNAAAEFRRVAVEVRRVGAIQDRTLANCRMATRWLGIQAAAMGLESPKNVDFTQKIQVRIEKTLQRK